MRVRGALVLVSALVIAGCMRPAAAPANSRNGTIELLGEMERREKHARELLEEARRKLELAEKSALELAHENDLLRGQPPPTAAPQYSTSSRIEESLVALPLKAASMVATKAPSSSIAELERKEIRADDLALHDARLGSKSRAAAVIDQASAPSGVLIGQVDAPRVQSTSDVQVRYWTSIEIVLSVALVMLTMVMIAAVIYLARKAAVQWSPQSVMRLLGLGLIIPLAIMLVVAGYSETQMSSAMGLLGVIAGYLLGNGEKRG